MFEEYFEQLPVFLMNQQNFGSQSDNLFKKNNL